ncbi:MAG: hypothetical protein AB7I50_15285 [Vicinamibacterales bacterium]
MQLTVYVSKGCWACAGVPPVLDRVRAALPALAIRIVDVDSHSSAVPPSVFSVPTYTLDEVVVSLGNPSSDFCDRLRARILAAKEDAR